LRKSSITGRRFGAPVEARAAGEQRLGVRMLRVLEDLAHRALLLDHAVLHHDDVVRDLAHDAEVVGDEEHRHVVLLLQLREQVEDLLLDA
jgi:hypothetical protein